MLHWSEHEKSLNIDDNTAFWQMLCSKGITHKTKWSSAMSFACKLLIKSEYSVFGNRYNTTKHNVAILSYIIIFLHPKSKKHVGSGKLWRAPVALTVKSVSSAGVLLCHRLLQALLPILKHECTVCIPHVVYEHMQGMHYIFVLKACDCLCNLIKLCGPGWCASSDRFADKCHLAARDPSQKHNSDVSDNQEVGLILHVTCFSLSVWSCLRRSHVHDKDDSSVTPRKIPTFKIVRIRSG